MSAPPILSASNHTTIDFTCGKCGTVLLHADQSQVNNLLIRCAVPVLYADQPIVAAGGLISYGTDAMDNLRIVDTYVGRILKGEKPADLPVQQPSKFQFIIDLQTARLIGVTMPPSLLTRADEIIE